jgi:ABC-type sugar transport system permease subunit
LLSIDLVKIALGQFDLGPAAAMSLIYFLIILLVSWVFYTAHDPRRPKMRRRLALADPDALHPVPDAADLLAGERCRSRPPTRSWGFTLFPQSFTLDNYVSIFTDPTWYWGYINSLIYVSINTVISVCVACPRPMRFRATGSSATSTCSSGC